VSRYVPGVHATPSPPDRLPGGFTFHESGLTVRSPKKNAPKGEQAAPTQDEQAAKPPRRRRVVIYLIR
jgi:hypothetical protein